MENWKLSDFEKIKEISKSSSSSIYLVRRKKDKKLYALKTIYMSKLKQINIVLILLFQDL